MKHAFSAPLFGDKFGESLGGSQAPPRFWTVPGLPWKFPELPRKFFGDFPGSSLTVDFIGARQRSGKGVVRRNGCPKGCFWRVRFFSAQVF